MESKKFDGKISEILKKIFLKFNNNGVNLENGDIVQLSETQDALEQYINSEQTNVNETHRVIKKRKIKVWPLPLVLAAMATMMFGFKINEETITPSSLINYSEISCTAYGINPDVVLNLSDDNIIFAGENESITNSYSIDYISIQDGNQIIDKEIKQGKDIKDVINDYCKENHKNIEDLDIKIHIDGPISGWVYLSDILKNNSNNQSIQINVMLDECYQVNLSFQRKYKDGENKLPVTSLNLSQKNINNGNVDGESVQLSEDMIKIDIVDKDGNLLPEGSIVVGSDGQKYIITDLNISTKKILELYPNETVSKLTWDIQNIKRNIGLSLMPIIIGLYSSYMFHELEKESEEEIDEEINVKSR